MDIEQLYKQADEIHAAMVAKGFYDQPKPTWQIMMLIEGELYEAIEGIRKGKKADLHRFQANDTMQKPDEYFRAMFDGTLKGSPEMEITDTYIRVLDYIGRVRAVRCWVNADRIDFNHYSKNVFESTLHVQQSPDWSDYFYPNTELLSAIRHTAKEIVPTGSSDYNTANKTAHLLRALELLVEKMDFDLQLFIRIKSRYNKLRAYKHGKNF